MAKRFHFAGNGRSGTPYRFARAPQLSPKKEYENPFAHLSEETDELQFSAQTDLNNPFAQPSEPSEEAPKAASVSDSLGNLLDAALVNAQRSEFEKPLRTAENPFADLNRDAAGETPFEADALPAAPPASKKAKTTKRTKKSIVFAILALILSLVFIVGGSVFVYAGNLLNSFQFVTPTAPKPSSGGNGSTGDPQGGTVNTDTPSVTGRLSPAEAQVHYSDPLVIDGLYHDDAIINILLMGTDDYVGDQGRTDSMMVVSIDRRHQKLKVTSFMRDMYVDLSDGWAPNRLNVAYFLGGASCLMHTIEDNFHVDLDHFAVISYDAFEKIIDAVGGIEVELSSEEASEVNRISEDYTSYATEGLNLLNGKQARAYARTRSVGGDGDFGRTSRQRTVFSSMVKKLKEASIFTISSIANEVVPEIVTDISQEEMVALLTNATTYFNYEVLQARVPSDEFYYPAMVDISGYESSVLVPDLQWNTIYANDFIYGDDFPELGATLEHYGYKRATGK